MTFGLLYLFGNFWRQDKSDGYLIRSLSTMAMVLFLELCFLGAIKKYPFVVPRTVLFFCPFVLYLTIQGITWVRHLNKTVSRVVHVLYFIFLLFLTVCLTRLVFTQQSVFLPII